MTRARAALDDAGLQRLLAALDDDAATAGRRYEQLRTRLIQMFRWKGLAGAEELADQAFDRAARRLAAGERLERGLAAYLTGIARKLVLERARDDARTGPLPGDLASHAPDPVAAVAEHCLERCLGEQPTGARELLLGYLAGQGTSKIAARKALAGQLGINANALRIRVHRIRATVEDCVVRCVASDRARNTSPPGPTREDVTP
jgi:hypothetical protein